MRIISWIIFIILVCFEGIFTTLPLTLIFLLCLIVMKRSEWIYFLAFVAGIVLDAFAMRVPGLSSLFFVSFMFLVLLYQRKYETATLPFVFIASFLGSMWYLSIAGAHAILLQSVLSSLICATAFALYRTRVRKEQNDGFQRV